MAAAAKIYFAVNTIETAQIVSQMLGRETIVVESGGSQCSGGSNTGWSESHESTSRSGGTNRGWSANDNWQQAPRELLKPEEVLALPPRLAITFPGGGTPPVLTRLVRYFEEPGLFKPAGGG